ELEAFEELRTTTATGTAAHAGEDVDGLPAGEVRPQTGVPGDVGQAPVDGDGVGPGVHAEHPGGARVCPEHAEEDPDRRRLAGTVGAEEPGHLPGGHDEVEPVQCPGGAEGL